MLPRWEVDEYEGYSRCPYRSLVSAVLVRAIVDLKDKNKHIREDAYQWLLDNEDGGGLSFVKACHLLDLSPKYVRRRILENDIVNEVSKIKIGIKRYE